MSARRVLVVDDELIIRVAIRLALRPIGVEVVEADCGRAALRVCAESPPDLVLLDLLMPDLTGLEVLNRLDADFKARVPILVVSATDDVRRQDEAFASGGAAFILKPYSNRALVATVEHFLDPAAHDPPTTYGVRIAEQSSNDDS